jgi:hypothetical protein
MIQFCQFIPQFVETKGKLPIFVFGLAVQNFFLPNVLFQFIVLLSKLIELRDNILSFSLHLVALIDRGVQLIQKL